MNLCNKKVYHIDMFLSRWGLGHSDLKMVQRYAHLESSTLRDAIETLEPKKQVINFNFGHHMDTTLEKVKTKEVIPGFNL